ATALASSLIGSFFKAWYTGWRINQVDKRYKDALREAKEIYHAEAVQEYEFAAQEANLAWQKITGKPPAITDAFRVLILGLLAGERDMETEGREADGGETRQKPDEHQPNAAEGPGDGVLTAAATPARAPFQTP